MWAVLAREEVKRKGGEDDRKVQCGRVNIMDNDRPWPYAIWIKRAEEALLPAGRKVRAPKMYTSPFKQSKEAREIVGIACMGRSSSIRTPLKPRQP
jgi:hypothetical protein